MRNVIASKCVQTRYVATFESTLSNLWTISLRGETIAALIVCALTVASIARRSLFSIFRAFMPHHTVVANVGETIREEVFDKDRQRGLGKAALDTFPLGAPGSARCDAGGRDANLVRTFEAPRAPNVDVRKTPRTRTPLIGLLRKVVWQRPETETIFFPRA